MNLLGRARMPGISQKPPADYNPAMAAVNIVRVTDLPFLTADLPGIGGSIKRYNEDFAVEEVPLYAPSGEGTHAYIFLEKQGLTTPAAIRNVGKALGRDQRDFGYAGLKDAHGITRQWISIEHEDPRRIAELQFARMRVLEVTLHTNKLKPGHLAGNRFILKIRDVKDCALAAARNILDVLRKRGMPNYFGKQRFGARGDNAAIGRAALAGDFEQAVSLVLGRPAEVDHGEIQQAREAFDRGDYEQAMTLWSRTARENVRLCHAVKRSNGNWRRAWKSLSPHQRRFYYSAFQSDLFNKVLARRLHELDKLRPGDIANLVGRGACFLVEDIEQEQPRCDSFEVSPTGPLFGPRMRAPLGKVAAIEAEVLGDAEPLFYQSSAPDGSHIAGERRALRVPVPDAVVEEGRDERGSFLQLTFSLLSGAYATCLTREICKTPESQ